MRIERENPQQAERRRARQRAQYATTKNGAAKGDEETRIRIERKIAQQTKRQLARYTTIKNRAAEGSKEAQSWLERTRINNQITLLEKQMVNVLHERPMYRTKVNRLMRRWLQVPLEDINSSELASKSPESLIAITEWSRAKIDRDRYQQWLLQIRDISILCLLSYFGLQL